MAFLGTRLEKQCAPFETAVAPFDTVPGVGVAEAQQVAEVGTDLDALSTAGHLCAWAGVSPGNYQESGGKSVSSRTRQGNQGLKNVHASRRLMWESVEDDLSLSRIWRDDGAEEQRCGGGALFYKASTTCSSATNLQELGGSLDVTDRLKRCRNC